MKRNYLILLLSAITLLSCASAQIMKTSLRITVLDELGNPVEGAAVVLYANEEDYNSSENPVSEKVLTNNKGIAKISDLESKVYFVDVQKGDKSNFDAGTRTNVLESGKINKVNIIIE